MDIILNFVAGFDCVYSVNGVFLESAERIKYSDNQVLYITVFPLKALLLPYTVKMVGGRVISNRELCTSYRLPQNNFFVRLAPRFNYVYTSGGEARTDTIVDNGLVCRFFALVKSERTAEARTLLTPALNSTIGDADISAFFADYVDIVENKYTESPPDCYFLIDKSGAAVMYKFVIENALIDNIEEMTS